MSTSYEFQYSSAHDDHPGEDAPQYQLSPQAWTPPGEAEGARDALVRYFKDQGYQVRVITTETTVTEGPWKVNP